MSECLCFLRPASDARLLTSKPDIRHACAVDFCGVQCGCKARGMWILNRVEDDGGAVEDDEVGPLRMTIVESRMAVVEPRMMFGEFRMMVGLCWAALCLAQPTDRDPTSYPAPSCVIPDPDRGSR